MLRRDLNSGFGQLIVGRLSQSSSPSMYSTYVLGRATPVGYVLQSRSDYLHYITLHYIHVDRVHNFYIYRILD